VIVTINNLLNALIEDKLSLENLITPELSERLKESMISRGYLYSVNTEEIEFDKEIQNLFDDDSKKFLNELNKGKKELT
jgi:hypothetical protein